VNESTKSFRGRLAVKAEKFEGNREARQALTLSMAGGDDHYADLEFDYAFFIECTNYKLLGHAAKTSLDIPERSTNSDLIHSLTSRSLTGSTVNVSSSHINFI